MVGEERMVGDILPVFEEYCTKDIDDVKIGALSHLAEFFEVCAWCWVKSSRRAEQLWMILVPGKGSLLSKILGLEI